MSQINPLSQISKLNQINQNLQQQQQQPQQQQQQQSNSSGQSLNQIQQNIQQQQQQQPLLDKPKRNPYCSRCRNHGKSAQVKGHKRHCEYRECQCDGCKLVECRQIVSAAQIKRRRYQKQDEECGRKIEVSPPKLARTTLDTDPATLIAKKLIGTAVAASAASQLQQQQQQQQHAAPPPLQVTGSPSQQSLPPPYHLINPTHHPLHLHDATSNSNTPTASQAATSTTTPQSSANLLQHHHSQHQQQLQSHLSAHSAAVGVPGAPPLMHQAAAVGLPLQLGHRLGLLATAGNAAASSQLLGLGNSHALNIGQHLQASPDSQASASLTAAAAHLNPHLGSVLQQHFLQLWKSQQQQQQQHLSHHHNHHQSQQQRQQSQATLLRASQQSASLHHNSDDQEGDEDNDQGANRDEDDSDAEDVIGELGQLGKRSQAKRHSKGSHRIQRHDGGSTSGSSSSDDNQEDDDDDEDTAGDQSERSSRQATRAVSMSASLPTLQADESMREQVLVADDLHQQYGLLAVFAWLKAESFDSQALRAAIERARPQFNDTLVQMGAKSPPLDLTTIDVD